MRGRASASQTQSRRHPPVQAPCIVLNWLHDNALVPPGNVVGISAAESPHRYYPPMRSSGCTRSFKRRIETQTVLPSADTAACITSGDTQLNCLIGNEPPTQLKCCPWHWLS